MLRVFVDANVLYSRTIRDWVFLLRLTGTGGIFQLHSTQDVITEAMYHLRKKSPLMKGRALALVRARIEDSLDEIVEDFDPSIHFYGDDVGDRHVHAAAIACRTDILVTMDEGFLALPNQDDLPYEIYHPDDFLVQVDDSAPQLVQAVTRDQRMYWRQKKHHSGLESALVKADCSKFAARIRAHLMKQSGVDAAG